MLSRLDGGRECEETDETKFSVRERESWMFFVRTSRTSLKLTETSASLPWRRTTTCQPEFPKCQLWLLKEEVGTRGTHIFVVFAFLIAPPRTQRLWMLRAGEGL